MESKDCVQCVHCGWVHFPVTFAYAMAEVNRFNKYYDTLTKAEQDFFAGPSVITSYTHCDRCGKSANMTRKVTNYREGSTIGPIIWEDGGPSADVSEIVIYHPHLNRLQVLGNGSLMKLFIHPRWFAKGWIYIGDI